MAVDCHASIIRRQAGNVDRQYGVVEIMEKESVLHGLRLCHSEKRVSIPMQLIGCGLIGGLSSKLPGSVRALGDPPAWSME